MSASGTDPNNNTEGIEQLLKKYTSDSFMYNLILPFETCQHNYLNDAVFLEI